MKIAFVITTFSIGGAQKVIIDLVEHMNRDVFDIRVIIHSDPVENQFTKRLEDNGIQYAFVHRDDHVTISSYKNLSKALNEYQPDVLHVHLDTLYAPLWVLLHNKRCIFTIHSQPYRLFRSRVIKLIFKSLLSRKNFVLTGVSKQISFEASEILNVPENKVNTIYNPVVIKDTINSIGAKNDREMVFVNVARFNPIKNQMLLIKAFSIVTAVCENVKLVFAGDGEMIDKCKDYAKQLELSKSIKFIGNVEDVYSELRLSDCFVLSSKSEAMPISILEAMACSLPVIAPRVGGIPELITDNGILYEVGNVEQLANAMINMAQNKEFRKKCSERSSVLVQDYDPKRITKQYELLYGIRKNRNEKCQS